MKMLIKTSIKLYLILFLLFSCQQILAASMCIELFQDDQRRENYINQTGTPSKIRAALQTLVVGITGKLGGTPKILRGIKMSGLWWDHYGQYTGNYKASKGEGRTIWGDMKLYTEIDLKENTKGIFIEIKPVPGSPQLLKRRADVLKEIFPSLEIEFGSLDPVMRADDGYGQMVRVPSIVKINLKREDMTNADSYELSARSLVETLFNDPHGLLGINPIKPILKYKVPKAISNESFLSNHLDFLGNFGEWASLSKKSFTAYKPRGEWLSEPGRRKTAFLIVDLENRSLGLWLGNGSSFQEALANVRRAAWSLLVTNLTSVEPLVSISGMNGVSVSNVKFGDRGIEYLKLLDETQNRDVFDQPLKGLSFADYEYLKRKFMSRLNQSDLNGQYYINLEDIAEKP